MNAFAFEPVIGLEVHVQLATKTKLFSGASTRFGALPNTQVSFIDAALPGTLPTLNAKAVECAIKLGLALHAHIAKTSIFARKNYFYPDLPKGYQISQYEEPIVSRGHLEIEVQGEKKTVSIIRAHLEEDAGKSLHEGFAAATAIDLNRAGTPLLEVVSAPELYSPLEAVAYAKALHTLVRTLGICDGNMQEGSFRMDANISLRLKGEATLGTRAEIKNLNSFRFLEKALLFEIDRQALLLASGRPVIQETRLFDSTRGETRSMRAKEEAMDYRYFPEPDLLPLLVEEEMIEAARASMPELPWEKEARLAEVYGLTQAEARTLAQEPLLAAYFEEAASELADKKMAAHWVLGEVLAALNRKGLGIEDFSFPAKELGKLLFRVQEGVISQKMAKEIFEVLTSAEENLDVDDLIEKKGLKQVSDAEALKKIIEKVLSDNPGQLAQFRAGKEKLFGFFVGQAMKATQGQANPEVLNRLLKEALSG